MSFSLEQWSQIAQIAGSSAGVLGVIGLAVYVIDTRKLRIVGQQQLEAGITPCVLLIRQHPQHDSPLVLKNVGIGIALNILARHANAKTKRWTEMSALGSGEHRGTQMSERDIINFGPLELTFESLSGTRYLTSSGFSEDTQRLDLVHTFKRL